jgi:glycosyltransferase involved in cell wall biosynthesis
MTTNPDNTLLPSAVVLQLQDFITNAGISSNLKNEEQQQLPEILFITSYPPRECGIATYSLDLITAIRKKFTQSFAIKIAALESQDIKHHYADDVKYILHTASLDQYFTLAEALNADDNLKMIFVQHEFGLYGGKYGEYILRFLSMIKKPVITNFHTVLPAPDSYRKKVIQTVITLSSGVIVMTKNSAAVLIKEYDAPENKITVIPHGTHLVTSFGHKDKKDKNYFGNRMVLSTFGLLSSGKSIETALEALPEIVDQFPNVLYLIIGKTHPGIIKNEGEQYREYLHKKVAQLGLENNVRFINKYLSLADLLDYLQRTDIYLFTSKDPHQAVSGTFAYAMSCGCPVISTPIPHAKELLDGAGIIVDFQNPSQLAAAAIKLLSDPALMLQMKLNALHKISPTAWENAAIAHMDLMQKNIQKIPLTLHFNLPDISLTHVKRLTQSFGMLQFSAIDEPEIASGYTLDDNARALIAILKHYALTQDQGDIKLIETYLNFILFCQQHNGNFLNYVDSSGKYFAKNFDENLEDSNGRAIWALGEIIGAHKSLNNFVVGKAAYAIEKAFRQIKKFNSPRAIAFSLKGLHHYNKIYSDVVAGPLIIALADDLVSKYRGVSDNQWEWFEEYLTYANSVLPESLLYAYVSTGNELYKKIAASSFNFLLSIIFRDGKIKVVSNQGWHLKGVPSQNYGEQPIDVAYTILALGFFYDVFKEQRYLNYMETAFNWFLGNNHLRRIMYNPSTGGCYDGLEERHVNLNQGAESTVSYLLARLTAEKYLQIPHKKTSTAKSIRVSNEAALV